MNIEILWTIAWIIWVVQALPQIFKVYKRKSAKDLSYLTLFMLVTCLSMWSYYWYVKTALPLVISNVILLNLYIFLIFLKYKYE